MTNQKIIFWSLQNAERCVVRWKLSICVTQEKKLPKKQTALLLKLVPLPWVKLIGGRAQQGFGPKQWCPCSEAGGLKRLLRVLCPYDSTAPFRKILLDWSDGCLWIPLPLGEIVCGCEGDRCCWIFSNEVDSLDTVITITEHT